MTELYKHIYIINPEENKELCSVFTKNNYSMGNGHFGKELNSPLNNIVKDIQKSDVCLYIAVNDIHDVIFRAEVEVLIAVGAGKKIYILDHKIPMDKLNSANYIFERYGKIVGYPGVVFTRDISVILEKLENEIK